MKSFNRIIILILAISITLTLSNPAYGFFLEDTYMEKGIKYLENIQNDDGGFPSKEGRQSDISTTSWVVMALSSAGEDLKTSKWTPDGLNPIDYILDSEIQLKETTGYARLLLALTSAGEGTIYNGKDLKKSITSFQSQNGHFGQEILGESTMINSHMWSILALKSAGVEIPNNEKAREWLISAQNDDGGYSWYLGGESDSDDTAVAVQTLIILGENPKSSTVIKKALEFIKSRQTDDGGFSSSDMMGSESNSASDSWVIAGLRAAGEDLEGDYWTKNDKNPLDHLTSLQNNNGSFYWQKDINSQIVKMTAFGITALSGKSFPVNIDYDKIIESNTPFTDLSKYHWAYDEILEMVGEEVIKGYPDKTFKAEKGVTREEFTSMVIKALGMENQYYSTNLTFQDLSKESWSYKYIAAAYKNSIIKGRSKYVFDPKGEITGGELATMLVNTLPEKIKEGYSEGIKWYSKNVSISEDYDILYPGFNAEKKATRAQCAYSIYKLMEIKK